MAQENRKVLVKVTSFESSELSISRSYYRHLAISAEISNAVGGMFLAH